MKRWSDKVLCILTEPSDDTVIYRGLLLKKRIFYEGKTESNHINCNGFFFAYVEVQRHVNRAMIGY